MHPCQEGCETLYTYIPQNSLMLRPWHFLGLTKALAILVGYNGSYIPLGIDTVYHIRFTFTGLNLSGFRGSAAIHKRFISQKLRPVWQ